VGFLTEMVEKVRKDLQERPLPEGTLLLRTRSLPAPLDFEAALRGPDLALIAEVKRASPSAGTISAQADPGEQAARYERGGASAISVLTQPRFFDGSLADLRLARRHTSLPILRKDFIVHPAQVIEARAEGADAVLLIAPALTVTEIEELRTVAEELGMAAVVEAHSEEDLDKALEGGGRIVGINARDLETLEVDLGAALDLAGRVPGDRVAVVESGISSRRRVAEAEAAGAHAVLVGEALMRAEDPEAMISILLGRLARRWPAGDEA
jgi:indole-3-glycerol phosphate synthase